LGKYPQEILTQVLAATDIVEIVGASLDLKPSGSGRFVALCPFHHEKTPSFHVTRERQRFHCFGCGKGGDAISFVMEFESTGFVEAVKKLAERAGIQLPAPSDREGRDEYLRKQLLEVGGFAARFYADCLKDPLKGGKARAYLKTRQLKEETVRRFGIGYAPDGWSTLLDAARSAGFRDNVIEMSGLVKRSDRGSYFDTFRERLIIPIRDASGNVVGLGGRDLKGDSPAKYMNSPETPVYKKSRVLFGLSEARDALRKEKRAIIVEGYFDLMRCVDAGIGNVVATCGTALTSEQASLLRRYVPEALVVFDGDAAGVRAALRGIAILAAAGLTVRALALPDNQDPDDYIRDQGVDAFLAEVEQALDFVTFYVRMNEGSLGSIEGRTDIAKQLFTIVQSIDDAMRTDAYLKQIARELQIDEWSVRREYELQLRRREADPRVEAKAVAAPSRFSMDDCDFVAVLISNQPLCERVRHELTGVTLKPGALAEVLTRVLRGETGRIDDPDADALYAAAATRPPLPADQAEILVDKRIRSLKRDALQAEALDLQEAIRNAEKAGDVARAAQLASRRVGINREIDRLGAA
jgi:DNA primase